MNTENIRYKKRFPRWLLILTCAALLGGAGFGVYKGIAHRQQVRAMEAAVYVDTYYAGTSIGGIDIGGLTLAQARKKVEQMLKTHYDAPALTIVYEGQRWEYTRYDLLDPSVLNAVIHDAWAMNRAGELADRYRRVMALQADGRDFAIDIAYTADAVEADLADIAGQIDAAPQNARIESDPQGDTAYTMAEAVYGQKVDAEETLAIVRKRIAEEDWGQVPLIVYPIDPGLRLEDLVIVDFATSIAGNTKSRAHNVRLALGNVDGYVLEPGALFSFNEVVGNRTVENGFLAAPIINKDKALVPGIGGGTCQASTTVYNAALRAGLQIVERHHHSFPVGYIAKGLDATVSWGSQDLKFVNPRDTPVFFHTYFENDNVHVVVLGDPFPNDGEIRCSSEVTGMVAAPAPTVRPDANLAPGQSVNYVRSRSGYRVTAYREYYENGELVERTVLHKDYYRPIGGIVLCGPEQQPPLQAAVE